MAIREVNAPPSTRTRQSKYPFDNTEVTQAIKLVKAGKNAGVGPYDGDNGLKEARSAGQSLVRHIVAQEPDLAGRLSTQAWVNSDGDGECLVKLKND